MKILEYNVASKNFESFEKEHEGATLRVSEVKPKLDRYLFNVLGNDDYYKGVATAQQKQWLIKDAPHPALNYKMKILKSNPSHKMRTRANLIITVRDDGLGNLITNNIKSLLKLQDLEKARTKAKDVLLLILNKEHNNESLFCINNRSYLQNHGYGTSTREIWLSSYIFSYLMATICESLKKYGEILIPNVPEDTELANKYKNSQAGLFPDRLIMLCNKSDTSSKDLILEIVQDKSISILDDSLKKIEVFLNSIKSIFKFIRFLSKLKKKKIQLIFCFLF